MLSGGSVWKGVVGLAGLEGVVLSGTSGSPNTFIDNSTSPVNATAEWEFRTDGTVWQVKGNAADVQFQDGIEWSAGQDAPAEDRWIRFTDDTGDASSSGDGTGTWHKVSGTGAANRKVGWVEFTDGLADQTGSAKVEIAIDSGGSTIIATGYYGATAQVAP